MHLKSTFAIAVLALAGAGSAFADTIPYPGTGSQNLATYTFTAASSGDLSAFFLGSGAGYDESLGLLVNGHDTGITGLENHTTPYGTALDFGHVSAGDVLVFKIMVADTGATYYSDKALNADGVQHLYATAYSGDAGQGIPAGIYAGFEDLPGGGDYNYTDEQFAFTNVHAAVPEPSGAALLLAGMGAMGLAALRRRRQR